MLPTRHLDFAISLGRLLLGIWETRVRERRRCGRVDIVMDKKDQPYYLPVSEAFSRGLVARP